MKTPAIIETLPAAATTAATTATGRLIPAAIAPKPEGYLLIPDTPFDIRTNMKEGSIRIGPGATEFNRVPAPLNVHICGFRTVRQIKLSDQYENPCDVSQILGIASVKGKPAYVCVTLSSSSSSRAEQAMKDLLLVGGIFANIVSLSIRQEASKKSHKFFIAEFAFRPATAAEIDLMLDLFEVRPDASECFLPLRDVSEKPEIIDTETGEVK